MFTIDVEFSQLDQLDPAVPVVVFIEEADVLHRAPNVVDVRDSAARIDLARRWSVLADRAPRLLATLRAAG